MRGLIEELCAAPPAQPRDWILIHAIRRDARGRDDRVSQAAFAYAGALLTWRAATQGPLTPFAAEDIWARVADTHYALAEALGMTEPERLDPDPVRAGFIERVATPAPRHDFVRGSNPRQENSCLACGRTREHVNHNQEVSPS